MSLLEVKDLIYEYGTGKSKNRAVDNISFSLEYGEILSIIGHTGSGKSTLVQNLNGLLKPKSGSVLLNGNNIFNNPSSLREARFKIGLIFQYPEHQLFEETVYKDISFGPRNMGLNESEINQRVLMSAEFVGLKKELLQKSPFELSGGEKRQAAIAGILAMKPEILILDEPTAGLDPGSRKRLLDNLILLRKTNNTAIIIVSHNMEDTAAISDKVMVMSEGKAVMFGTPRDVFYDDKRLLELSLEIPQITKIIKHLKLNGCNIREDIFTVDEAVSEILHLLTRSK